MKTLLKLIIAALAISCSAWAEQESAEYKAAFELGKKDAETELAKGIYAVEQEKIGLLHGTPPPNLAEHLKKKYSIELRLVDDLTNFDKTRGHMEGFNEIMYAAIDQKHGKDAIHKAHKEASFIQGKADARKELKEGTLAIETMGLLVRHHGHYAKILKERYNIQVRGVAGCMVNSFIIGHAEGFNQVMNAEIKRRFGKNVFEHALTEAEELLDKELEAKSAERAETF